MNFHRSTKIALVTLFAAKSFIAGAQTSNVPAATNYPAFSKFITGRNIFNPNRVAHVEYVPNARTYVAPPRPPDTFSLVGTLSYEKGDFAFFDGTASQFRKAVVVNDSIATFKVAAVQTDSVTLTQDTNTTVLKIGEVMRDDGEGHWLSASQIAARASSGYSRTSGGSGRTGFGNRRRGNNFGRGGNNGNNGGNGNSNRGGNDSTPPTTSANDNSQPQDDQNMQSPPNEVYIPVDMSSPDDATAPETETTVQPAGTGQ